MEPSAEPDGDGYRLSGSKSWITNTPIADIAVVWAKTAGGSGPRGFVVETDRE